MVGILKNPLSKDDIPAVDESENVAEFRKQVFMNTQLNAKLTKGQASEIYNELAAKEKSLREGDPKSGHGFVPRDSVSLKHEHDVPTLEEEINSSEDGGNNLQWNKNNLAENEIKKLQYANIHVDEPKTPYQGAVDPSGEYYTPDDEDEPQGTGDGAGASNVRSLSDLDGFTLGEPEYKMEPVNDDGRIEMDPDEVQEADEEAAEEAKHRRFEEMRKKHYNVKEVFKNRHPADDE
ncbi:hypothetical protein TPHA_0L02330 [Tetrapisispora phaffii CBS 4417]|uniref:Protein GLC8 n=1 Tax=Tetrapisispora phaffii (strain ATCC 24235 / CBS 4417 / NBRC 1672 / NRRL Y-8282 / UCD 70-5) TaxID=1071381 RepID=G8C0A6_TETPH|nr:hypothetical protein TPHA_0L02330 [Tetrapisispora phaffii CBS 4417]CCE65584.1 hypothetical protein TPHA_0L02330 [Tetrapisispora phaffii CBS 4417]